MNTFLRAAPFSRSVLSRWLQDESKFLAFLRACQAFLEVVSLENRNRFNLMSYPLWSDLCHPKYSTVMYKRKQQRKVEDLSFVMHERFHSCRHPLLLQDSWQEFPTTWNFPRDFSLHSVSNFTEKFTSQSVNLRIDF